MITEQTRQRMDALQKRLDESGMKSIHFTMNPEADLTNKDKVANDMCSMVEAYLDGNYTEIPQEELEDL